MTYLRSQQDVQRPLHIVCQRQAVPGIIRWHMNVHRI